MILGSLIATKAIGSEVQTGGFNVYDEYKTLSGLHSGDLMHADIRRIHRATDR